MIEARTCSANCQKFRCGKDALQFRGQTAWCRWSDDQCDPTDCNYPVCVTRRLLSNGMCGETVRRKTVEKEPEEDAVHAIKVKGKTYRKIGEKEIF